MAVEPPTSAFPRVAGTCPACGYDGSLFVGAGGYITCARDTCPDPGAVADLLDRPAYHVLEVGEDGWAIQHAITCFPDLLDCETHKAVSVWMETLAGPPAPIGRYRLNPNGNGRFHLEAVPPVEPRPMTFGWSCPRCGSRRWVPSSLDHGRTRTPQCVPCGHYDTAHRLDEHDRGA